MMRDPHDPLNPWPQPTLVRRALDELLDFYPFFDLLKIDWQPDDDGHVTGPWVLVELGQPSTTDDAAGRSWAVWKFAIWKTTGAVHFVGPDGAVTDDPIIRPRAAAG